MKPPTGIGANGQMRNSRHRIANIRQEQVLYDQNTNPNSGILQPGGLRVRKTSKSRGYGSGAAASRPKQATRGKSNGRTIPGAQKYI